MPVSITTQFKAELETQQPTRASTVTNEEIRPDVSAYTFIGHGGDGG